MTEMVASGCASRKADVFSGGQSHRGKSQEPRSWTAGCRETETLKPVDKPILGWGASHWAVTRVNAEKASKVTSPKGRARNRRVKAAWIRRSLTDAASHLGGVSGDGTMTKTRGATGEALLVPPRKRRSKVRPITMTAGKGAEGERVAEGPAVARKVGNATGAMGPCCSAVPLATREAGVR